MELKNTVIGVKNSIESINSRLDHIEESVSELEGNSCEINQSEEQEYEKEWEGHGAYGSPLRDTIYVLLESQKEKTGRKGQRVYLKI